jgi:2-dehydropantoate 2-reductase
MRIAVIGIGGVGGYYGGKLARHYAPHSDMEVIFVARGKHLEEIQRRGLLIRGQEETFTAVPARATDRLKALGALDLIIFCVKGYDLENAAGMVLENVGTGTTVLPLMNGVDNGERLRSLFSKGKILEGCVYISSKIESPGVIRQLGGSRQLFFGSEENNEKDLLHYEILFRNAGIKAQFRANIQGIVWEKFIFISPVASTTALFGKPFGAVMEKEATRNLLEGLMGEVERVGRIKGVEFPADIVSRSLEKISMFPYETRSSMQVDLENGRRTELETFTGYVVRAGHRLGIELPLHQMVYTKLKRLCR